MQQTTTGSIIAPNMNSISEIAELASDSGAHEEMLNNVG